MASAIRNWMCGNWLSEITRKIDRTLSLCAGIVGRNAIPARGGFAAPPTEWHSVLRFGCPERAITSQRSLRSDVVVFKDKNRDR